MAQARIGNTVNRQRPQIGAGRGTPATRTGAGTFRARSRVGNTAAGVGAVPKIGGFGPRKGVVKGAGGRGRAAKGIATD